jgi:hypothetical protein
MRASTSSLFVVDYCVEPRLLFQPLTLVRAACDTDDTTAFDPGDLTGHRPRCAGCTGHQHRFAGLRFAEVEHAPICREPGGAEYGERHRQRHAARQFVDAKRRAPRRRNAVILPTAAGQHVVAGNEVRMIRRDDLTDGTRPHHLADFDRRQVTRTVFHPTALGWVERQVQILDQYLTIAGFWNASFPIFEVRFANLAVRTFREHPLPVYVRHFVHLHRKRAAIIARP